MIEFHKIWIEQCEAAEAIKDRFGTEKAAGYLIGEKLLEFISASNTRPEFAGELPDFVREIKNIFTPNEIRSYFGDLKRVGAAGHVMTDEQYNAMREAGALDTNVVRGAEDVIIVARMREMLSEESAS
jgi:hypothetical protein